MKLIYVMIIALSLTACASKKIIIDRQGVNMSRYEQDMETCKQYAEEVEAGSNVVGGAVGGAVVGGAVGAILGGRKSAEKLAAVGGVTGAAKGSKSVRQEKTQVIKNCLRNRGYKVLN